jgi:hypothetical protein
MSPSETAGWAPRTTSPGHTIARSPTCGVEDSERTGGTAERATAECGGTDIRKSESLIVPTKSGNLPEGTRWREGEAGSWNRRKER